MILTVAADDKRFEQIRGSSSRYAEAQKLDIGDGAWLFLKDDDLNVVVHKGRTVIHLSLDVEGAAGQSAALIALAHTVAAKVT